MTAPPAIDRAFNPVSIGMAPDQLSWLDHHARSNRISRSALVRQAVDLLIKQQLHRRPHS